MKLTGSRIGQSQRQTRTTPGKLRLKCYKCMVGVTGEVVGHDEGVSGE